jgi:hypothetical protein
MWKLAKLKKIFRKSISFFLIFQLSFFQLASLAIPQLVYAQAETELTASYDATAHELDLALSQNSESEYRVYYQADQLEAVTGIFSTTESVFLGICSDEGDCVEDAVNRLVVKVNVDNEIQVQRLELIDDVLNLVDSYTSVSLELDDDEQFWLENKTAQGWQENEDGSYTIDNVELDHVYTAPQNDQVSVTFTKLPEKSGTLSIEEITLSDDQVTSLGALSNKAYDITSSMENGTFEIDLTLPKPKDSDNAQIKFSEKASDLGNAENIVDVSVGDDKIGASGVNHFTVFVVVGTNTEKFDEADNAVVINEFVFDPDTGDEWVELYNKDDSPVDIGAWQICEISGSSESCDTIDNNCKVRIDDTKKKEEIFQQLLNEMTELKTEINQLKHENNKLSNKTEIQSNSTINNTTNNNIQKNSSLL